MLHAGAQAELKAYRENEAYLEGHLKRDAHPGKYPQVQVLYLQVSG